MWSRREQGCCGAPSEGHGRALVGPPCVCCPTSDVAEDVAPAAPSVTWSGHQGCQRGLALPQGLRTQVHTLPWTFRWTEGL